MRAHPTSSVYFRFSTNVRLSSWYLVPALLIALNWPLAARASESLADDGSSDDGQIWHPAAVWTEMSVRDDAPVAPPRSAREVLHPEPAGFEAATAALPQSLTPRMKHWVRQVVPERGTDLVRLRRLSRALLDPDRFQLTEHAEHTGTASEVFRSRQANCVGYAMLFVGMARELGVPVRFVVFEGVRQRARKGDLRVAYTHMAAAYDGGKVVILFDFGGERRSSPHRLTWLSDAAASAVFYSNAGVELLLDGKAVAAVEHLELAVRLDPTLIDGWTNLGVALRRLGNRRHAREAERRTLDGSSMPR